ncbi:tRNA (adenosine(37)-N6)-threonylcarbamoyltransferase complex dimerization subunit type 1 TsaB [Thiocystis violascens]|uniref:tRNA threonylcarbamoyladenosine biosynthesis protein TsaB n=1 Tax=Thiocystis violascens (strain ATCC 17096 / DSM 198 / 6111) TaxID=765911 RepID=I3YGK1_THIV6|nr:tRNA (adenosine(37)-N6)-threonylcarbamoyltransferase complex dimerization subunit type 1 TsaB [Thiocystis violascens]AFL76119.1 universal bacterial protein YeaZ [Thiocystis violascens DSM 198]
MKLLAIDTSGDACSAALLIDGKIEQLFETAPRRHGERILPMMQDLLDRAGLRVNALDALAFGCGPGSFTGVRIAAAVIQGAAFGADLPVLPVSTLGALAQGQFRRGGQRRLLTALDARMGEVYWGCFEVGEDGLAAPRGEEAVCPPDRVELPANHGWYGVGSGWAAHTASLTARVGDALAGVNSDALCEARDIVIMAAAQLHAGRQVSPELAAPVYLRDRVTRT